MFDQQQGSGQGPDFGGQPDAISTMLNDIQQRKIQQHQQFVHDVESAAVVAGICYLLGRVFGPRAATVMIVAFFAFWPLFVCYVLWHWLGLSIGAAIIMLIIRAVWRAPVWRNQQSPPGT